MTLNFADLIVLGDDISGIAAGSLLAKRGFNVLVVDRPAPSRAMSIPGLETRGFRSFISKLGIPEARLRSLKKNPIAFQVVLPDHRIDVTSDEEHLFSELDREFPEYEEWTRQLFDEIESTQEEEARPLLTFLPWLSWREKRRFLKKKTWLCLAPLD